MFTVSLSQIGKYKQCRQAYAYGYVRRLRRTEVAIPVTKGRMLHQWLALYYEQPTASYLDLAKQVGDEYHGELQAMGHTAFSTGDEAAAKEYFELEEQFYGLCFRYHKARGEHDRQRWQPILIEHRLISKLTRTIQSNGVVDLVVRDTDTGLVHLVEHKSTKNVPPPGVRLQDMQTLLYAAQLKNELGIEINSVLWNYLRTKPPETPRILKDGRISLDQRIDSDYFTFAGAVIDAGDDPLDPRYNQIVERLRGRDLTVYFPRYEQVMVVDPGIMLAEYIQDAQLLKRDVSDWQAKRTIPTRSLDRHCSYCEFRELCQAHLTGGDEEDVIKLKFEYRKPHQESEKKKENA